MACTSQEISSDLISMVEEEDLSGYAYATEAGFVEFPRDLGPHPDFQTEWWYYTGNVEADDGRQFGYQFTIFRRAIQSPDKFTDNNESDWRTNQIYFAHAAIADIENNRFLFGERFSRGAAGLAGAQAEPYEIWIENWQVKEIAPGVHEMSAEQGGVGFKFTLTETQPPVLHAFDGFSPKSETEVHASYYYSLVGLETEGEIFIGDERFNVTGQSWKDHEFGTNIVGDDASGWDWFAMQFETGESLMFGNVRLSEGGLDPFSGGSWIYPDSSIDIIRTDADLFIEITDTWTSPNTDGVYPSEWTLEIPDQELNLTVSTLVDDAELLVGSTMYWEGPIYYEGTMGGQPVSGYGYVELTGYVSPIDI